MFKTVFCPACAAVLMALLTGNASADIQGRVIRVIDGDTIEVLQVTNERSRVRLDGIDAPEKKQAFGQRSRQFLNNQVGQQIVVVTGDKTDRYGRILGTVWLEDQDVNAMQVGNGMAWAYRYHGKASNSEYLRMEKEARKEKRGLWADPDPVEPWKWRMNYR
ncbi:thermonuclease family protein [Citrobacter braakii]|uniref:thermonuclease family protein n=1 Tax=Citrobacter braakii TaxID=57706 RepID=UPI003F6F24F3